MTVKRHDVEACIVENCFQCKINSIQFSPAANISKMTPKVREQREFQEAAMTDVEAYRRLRKEGFQPRAVRGSARLEKTAESRFEIESGYRLSSAKVGAKYDEAMGYLPEIMKPLENATSA